jgi:hypothetical protein
MQLLLHPATAVYPPPPLISVCGVSTCPGLAPGLHECLLSQAWHDVGWVVPDISCCGVCLGLMSVCQFGELPVVLCVYYVS